MVEKMKRPIDVEIAKIMHNQEKDTIKLAINEDTSYDINFDIYETKEEKYFYIKLTENTADAPFYYIRSYTIKDLYRLNKIYRVFGKDNLEEFKNYMKTLFEKNKVSLKFEENEAIIKMDISAQLFASEEYLFFELYREMIISEEEKDDKLLDIYILNKNYMKALKEITIYVNNFKGNQKEMELIPELKNILSLKEIPGIEKGIKLEMPTGKEQRIKKKEKKEQNEQKEQKEQENKIEIIEENIIQVDNSSEEEDENKREREKEDENQREIKRELEEENEKNENQIIEQEEIIINEEKEDDDDNDDLNSKIFTDLKDNYTFSEKDKIKIPLTIKNIFDEEWKAKTIKLICNENVSTIKFSKIKYFKYDIEKGQDGDFEIRFDKKDLIKGKKYKCYLQLFVNERKITDKDLELNIEIN